MFFLIEKREEKNKHIRRFSKNNKTIFSRINKFEDLTDVRHTSYVKYSLKVIFIVRLMALMCEINAFKRLAKKIKNIPKIKNNNRSRCIICK